MWIFLYWCALEWICKYTYACVYAYHVRECVCKFVYTCVDILLSTTQLPVLYYVICICEQIILTMGFLLKLNNNKNHQSCPFHGPCSLEIFWLQEWSSSMHNLTSICKLGAPKMEHTYTFFSCGSRNATCLFCLHLSLLWFQVSLGSLSSWACCTAVR